MIEQSIYMLVLGLLFQATTPTVAPPPIHPTSKPNVTPPPSPPDGPDNQLIEMTAELHEGVARGFQYLALQQSENGSFGQGRFTNHVGITSLAAIAYLSNGNTPTRGEYSKQVALALQFILNHSTETGLIAGDTSHGPMYGHGFATLFLGEVYGMSAQDKDVRTALGKAVDLIVRTQNKEGGWRYKPVPDDADVSVTICQIMALRSARNAGISIDEDVINRAVAYVQSCQNEDGGWRYMIRPGSSAWPRTAAGVASLYYAGIHQGESIEKGLDYLERNALPSSKNVRQSHYYYGQYYAVQAMYLAGGARWARWWPAAREALLGRQSSNGGWLDHQVGGAYASAMALIILQMPKRYLPIFQR
jgi:hypothetical protein